jgi:parallel beta-helix repeat protein
VTVDVRYVALAVAGLLVLNGAALAVQPGTEDVQPVEFSETLTMGMTGVDVRAASEAGYVLPRAQVFYGQFQYVVGYYGVESLATHLDSGVASRQFGDPLAVFVTDFSGSDPHLVDGGYLDVRNDPYVGWTRAAESVFVVDSGARTPAGNTVVPFSERADARTFADEYGGRVVDWEELRQSAGGAAGVAADSMRASVANQSAWADRQVDRATDMRSRPVSVVVGEDAPTLAAAVDAAPPNTTVRVPPGRYDANLTVRKPLTIRGGGADTVLDGGGNGTAVRVRADRVALTDVAIENTGTVGTHRYNATLADQYTDRTMQVYGQSDAGVRFARSNDSLLADVSIDTAASGVVLQYSDRTVVRNVTVTGTETWADGLMGVLPMYSRVVVTDSTLHGGRDGVYTHRADGSVVRDNEMADQRYGIHEMYTSNLLLSNNTIRDAEVGIMLMTRPRNNLVVGNTASGGQIGILTVGDTSYVAGNVVFGNDVGLSIGTTRSVVTRNTAVDNGVGLKASTLMPTNHVYANDVFDNERPASSSGGPVHVWTVDGRGNYWGETLGLDRDGNGVVDRPFRPDDDVSLTASRAAGGPTLARSPAVALLRQVEGSLPGLRDQGVLDLAPRTDPVRPDVLREVRNRTHD